MRLFPLGPLYPITSDQKRSGINHVEQARELLRAGIRFFQVRDKHLRADQLLPQLRQIQNECRTSGGYLVVNDRVDLAVSIGAAGVHLGQDDLPVEAARRIGGPELIIGLSTHTYEEFQQAQSLDVDYVAIGPVFESPTKKGIRPPLGLLKVRAWVKEKRLPVVAIGGIDLDGARQLWDIGVDSVAVISDLLRPDRALRIRAYLEASAG